MAPPGRPAVADPGSTPGDAKASGGRLLRAAATVGGLTVLSRIAGFVRDVMMAVALGVGPVADAFLVALKLPNLFRRLFAEGAFAAAFVPMFSARVERDGIPAAMVFASRAATVLILVLCALTVFALIFMPYLIAALAPGFGDTASGDKRAALAIGYALITFPYLLLIATTALFGACLNATGRFAPFAAAPILFNICLIGACALAWWQGLARGADATGWLLAGAVLLAGVVQLFAVGWFARQARVLPRPALVRRDPELGTLLQRIGPAAASAGVQHLNTLLDLILASLLPVGAITFLYFADRLYQLPLGVLGIAVGTALLPLLSRRIEASDWDGASIQLRHGIQVVLFIGLPSAAGLMAAATPIISVLFTPEHTDGTAIAVRAYAVGVPAFLLLKVLQTAFFARGDTMAPLKAGIIGMAVNAVGSIAAIATMDPHIAHAGLALATSAGGWATALVLLGWLIADGRLRPGRALLRRGLRMVLASAVMGLIVLIVAGDLAAHWAPEAGLLARVGSLLVILGTGVLCYGAGCVALGLVSPAAAREWLRRARGRGTQAD